MNTAQSGLGDREDGDFRSGFVAIVGRPNVGKSTLVNRILGQKVAIVSDKPQTTRTQIRGILNRPDLQIVFVDTPGIHKPRSPLGRNLNRTASASLIEVDAAVQVIDATQKLGPGDRFVAERMPAESILVVNKVDRARPQQIVEQLAAAAELGAAELFPVSALTGEGVDALVEHIVGLMPPGPCYYPDDVVTDVPEAFWVAELVREQLLAIVREELPHSIATRVTEWEWPRVRCEILVERESQKGMVIGKNGANLKKVGTAVRTQMPEGAFIELHVKVEKNWQRSAEMLERFGY